jgi:Tfp pilus assembly ATPase PilU
MSIFLGDADHRLDTATVVPAERQRRPRHRARDQVGILAIRNLIREDKVAQMYSAIQTGSQYGMQTLDQCLQDMVKRGLVTRQQAMGYAKNKEIFK